MSTTIDEKVVEMRFDNKDFEKNVKTSIDTVDNLKKSLQFDGVKDSLSNLEKTTKGIKLGGLSDAVDTVKQKFSALEVIAITTLANITNSAVNAGKNLVRSLTIEPISQGFSEYELKMNSVQTIMASTGADLKTVNGYLDDLNKYADRTIYSFSDMTANIGKFTNSGVALEDAVKAIQGISNEAAVSGANAQEASRAMYNFAQALSAGYVKLIDWKSIENANMATVEFKQSLLDTALAMGTVVKVGDDYKTTTTNAKGEVSDAFNATKGFNDALSNQWMTTEVLTQTLANYSTDIREMTNDEKKAYEEKLKSIGYTEEQIATIEKLGQKAFDAAQDVKTFHQLLDTLKEAVGSGWSQSFETIFGDFEEAKKLWTAVSNVVGGVIDAQSKARNEMLDTWKSLGGREALFESIANIWTNIRNILSAVKEGFRSVFPKTTGDQLAKWSKNLRDFTKTLLLNDDALNNIRSTVRGLAAVLDIGRQILSALFNGVKSFIGVFGDMSNGFLSVTGTIGDFLYRFSKLLKDIKVFEKVVSGIVLLIKALINWIGKLFKVIMDSGLGDMIENLTNKITSFFKAIELVIRFFSSDNKSWKQISDFTEKYKILTGKFPAKSGLYTFLLILHDIKEGIADLIHGDDLRTVIERYFGGDFGIDTDPFFNMLDKIKPVFTTITDVFKNAAKVIKNAVDSIRGSIEKTGDVSTEGVSSLADKLKIIFAPITLLFEGLKFIITGVFKLIKAVLPLVSKALKALGNFIGQIGDAIKDTFSNTTMTDLAKGGIFVLIVKKIIDWIRKLKSGIDSATSIFDTLKGIAGNVGEFVKSITSVLSGVKDSLETWQKDIKANILLKIASAIGILTVSLVVLSSIDKDKLNDALSSMTLMFVELIGSLKVLTATITGLSVKDAPLIMGLMVTISTAILMLSVALKTISKLEPKQMAVGIAAVIGLMTAMVIVAKQLSSDGNKMLKGISGIVAFAAAILILTSAVKKLSKIDPVDMLKGLGGLGVILLELVAFFKMLNGNKPEKLMSFGAGLILVAEGLKVMIGAVKKLSKMDPESMLQGLGGLGFLLVELTAFFKALGKPEKMISFGIGLQFLAGALVVLSTAIKILGSLDLEHMAIALVGLGGSLALIIAAFAVLELSKDNLPKVAGGLLLLTNAITVLAIAMKIFGTMDLPEIGAALMALGGALLIMVMSLNAINPTQALKTAGAISAFAGALVILAPVLKLLGSMSLNEILSALVMLGSALIVIGVAGMAIGPIVPSIFGLAKAIALLGVGVMALGGGLFLLAVGLSLIADSAEGVVKALVGMVEGIIGLIPTFISVIGESLGALLKMLYTLLPDVGKFLAELFKMVLKTLAEITPVLAETLLTIIVSVLDSLARNVPKIVSKLSDLIAGLLVELGRSIGKIVDALVEFLLNLIESTGKAIKKYSRRILDTVFDFIIDILAGALNMVLPWLMDWITGSIDVVVEKINVLTEEQQANIDKSYEMAAAYRELRDARNESIAGIDSEYSYIRSLRDEYNSYIDSNGNIIAGYESRANVILTTLADAMGKEVEDIQGLIDANGKLGESFDQLMVKMEAEAYLEANKEAYTEAIKNQKEVQSQYAASGHLLNELRGQLADADAQYANIMNTYNNTLAQGYEEAAQRYLESNQEFFAYHEELKNKVGEAQLAYGQAQMAYTGVMQEISNTQQLMAAASSGSVDEMKKAMEDLQYSFVTAGNGTRETLIQQVGAYKSFYQDLKAALEDGMDGVTKADVEAAQKRLGRAEGELAKYEAAHEKSGEQADIKLAKSIEKHTDKVVKSEKKVMDDTVKTAEDKSDDIKVVGQYLDQGLADGIMDYSYLPENAMGKVVDKTKTKAKTGFDVHSPSKVFAEIGKNLDMGLADGIKDFQGDVVEATEGLGESAINGMNETIAKMYDYLDSNMDTSPTIRPVLDLSQVSSGVNDLNSMIDSHKSYELSAMAKLDSDKALLEAQNGLTVNNKDVISTILSIREDISNLSDKVGQMQIVMDTGTLVGQIAQPIDSALGRRAYLKERGI